MAMPFIFGNHQCPFSTFRTMPIFFVSALVAWRNASREGFSSGSRSRAPRCAFAHKVRGDDEPGEKTRGMANVRKAE
jgi:hypothetical protein